VPARADAIPPKQQARRSGGTEPRGGPPVGGPQTGEGSALDGGWGEGPSDVGLHELGVQLTGRAAIE
jgi:hypothetical protein